MGQEIPLGVYLFERIAQLGIKHIFGVPGDFNLQLLDYIFKVKGLDWVGCCNELNAAYAADGYARSSNIAGVVVTTYGVGELSALNGVSGASSENVPVLHIIGQTPRFAQEEHKVLHHSTAPHGLKPNDHTLYMKASEPLCCAWEQLWDTARAPDQIDRVINAMMREREPGVLFIPLDVGQQNVDSTNLTASKITGEISVHPRTDELADAVVEAFSKAKNPVVVSDDFVKRFNLGSVVTEVVERTGSWGYVSFMGRSTIDETHPQFAGIYNGHQSYPGVTDHVEDEADFVLCLGPHASDFNSGFYSRRVKPERRIILHAFYANKFGESIDGVSFVHVLERVLQRLPKGKQETRVPKPKIELPNPTLKGEINQENWPAIVQKALTPGSMLAIDTGTFQMASIGTALPPKGDFLAQLYYGSIGWALPAAFGAAVGKLLTPQENQRVVLVEGDGSAQMTIQELSSIIRFQLPVTILLMNNSGYAIERCIWGPEQIYNEINTGWQWTNLFTTFGAREGETESYRVTTAEDAVKLFESPEFRSSTKPQLVEVIMPKYDYPKILKDLVERSREANKASLAEFQKRHSMR